MVTDRVNAPVELLVGNHEDDVTGTGSLSSYVRCLPDRLGVTGAYAKDYWVDRGSVRFVMIAPGILIGGVRRTYADRTPEQAWLREVIRAGHASGRWVVVGMHLPCLTLGVHGCASSPDLTDALIEEKVDLSLAGHDHNYIRSHQLGGSVAAARVVDRDNAYTAGAGTVFAVVGNGGHKPRTVGTRTALWAAASGTNSPGGMTFGFAQVSATATTLTYRLVRTSGGTLSDGVHDHPLTAPPGCSARARAGATATSAATADGVACRRRLTTLPTSTVIGSSAARAGAHQPLPARERGGEQRLLEPRELGGQEDRDDRDQADRERLRDRGGQAARRVAPVDQGVEHRAEPHDDERHRHRHAGGGRARLVGAGDQRQQGGHEEHGGVDQPHHHGRTVGDRHGGVPRRTVHDVGVARVDGDDDDAAGRREEEQEQHHRRGHRHALVDVEDRGGEEQQHQGEQLGHLVAHVRHDLVVDAAPDLDGVHEGAEVVVGEHHPRRLLGHLAAAAHGDPDVGLLQGRGVVDRVTGHRHDQALLLHRAGQPQLVLGGDPAEDVQHRQPLLELVVAERLQLGAADRPGPEPELLTDRLGGDGVVAGDHPHVDAGREGGR